MLQFVRIKSSVQIAIQLKKILQRIGPLKAGRYPFVDEFNEATAKGVVIAE